jgi:hypothetical protein
MSLRLGLGVSGAVVARVLAGYPVAEILARGARGGSLSPLASSSTRTLALAQLPARTGIFTGRGEDLADLLDPDCLSGPAVAGAAGVGKTTLAIHAGHAAVAGGCVVVDSRQRAMALQEMGQLLP